MADSPSVWGRYPDQNFAKLAMRQFLGDPDNPVCRTQPPFYRVRYAPSERHPKLPWVVMGFTWQEEADAWDAEGVIK